MSDVFISYARDDREKVRELVRLLEENSWTVFWDRDIAVGADFERRIEEELTRTECVVVVWSDKSTESSWVRGEAFEGLDRGILVPVRIDDCRLPLVFRSIETADLRGWPERTNSIELRKLLAAVERLLNSPVTASSIAGGIRDDSTISTRVARRVIDALNAREVVESRLEALYLALAIDRTKGVSLPEAMRFYRTRIADALGATTTFANIEGQIVDLEGDMSCAETLSQLEQPANATAALVAKSEFDDATGIDWCLLVPVAATTTFGFAGRGDSPDSRLINRLGTVIAQLMPVSDGR